jgi:hypothetical protein
LHELADAIRVRLSSIFIRTPSTPTCRCNEFLPEKLAFSGKAIGLGCPKNALCRESGKSAMLVMAVSSL